MSRHFLSFFVAATTLFQLFSLFTALSCKDEFGNDIPTWTIQKLPQGTKYYYYDTEKGYAASAYSLNETDAGALAHTMQQLWKVPNVSYVIYNDEPPRQATYNFSVAHSKGVWMWDDQSAIVLTHSIPKFPSGPQEASAYGGLEENAWEYGQSASCFQIPRVELGSVWAAVKETGPLVYESRGEGDASTGSLEAGTWVGPCQLFVAAEHTAFIKPVVAAVDIWAACIATYYGAAVRVESWIHGTMDGPFCPPEYPYAALDIQKLQFPHGESVIERDDHSKWGIIGGGAGEGAGAIVCFGDLNRVDTQMQRAGTVHCWNDTALWGHLDSLVAGTNSCT